MPTDITLTEPESAEGPASVDGQVVKNALLRSLFGRKEWTKVGRFEIRERVGAGGMGTVFSAHDPELGRLVAIKLLSPDLSASTHRERLRMEAQAMAKLNHPNVATVYEVGTHEGQLFVAMELIEGQSLREWSAEQGRPWTEVLDVYLQAGDGLVAAHEAGLVHRDFKPDNVMLGHDGRVRVLDFGLAASFGRPAEQADPEAKDTDAEPRLTRTGAVMGTPAYMPPEQLAGERADARSDQFAFCVALFEALYGQRPFAGETLDTIKQAIERGEIVGGESRSGPAWLRAAVRRGLRHDPAQRWSSVREFVTHLRRRRRRRVVRWAAAGVGSVGVAGTAAFIMAAPPPICGPADEEFAGTWDEATRDRLQTRFDAAALPAAGASFRSLSGELDELSEDWTRTWEQSCNAGEDPRVQLRRLDCLRQNRQLVGFYTTALGMMPVHAATLRPDYALRLVPDPIECTDPKIIRAIPDPPSATESEAVDATRAALLGTLAFPTPTQDKIDALFDPIIERAEGLTYPVLAEVLIAKGRRMHSNGIPPMATFQRAIEIAEEARHDRAVAQARLAILLGIVNAGYMNDLGTALEDAEAAVVRAGNPLDLRARLLGFRGVVALVRRDWDAASAAFERGKGLYIQRYGEGDLRTGQSLAWLFDVAEARGDIAGARKAAADARETVLRIGGPKHLGLALTHIMLARAEWLSGGREASEIERVRFREAHERARPPGGSLPPQLDSMMNQQELELEFSAHRCTAGMDQFETQIGSATPEQHAWLALVGLVASHACLDFDGELGGPIANRAIEAVKAGARPSYFHHVQLMWIARALSAAVAGNVGPQKEALAELERLSRLPGMTYVKDLGLARIALQQGRFEPAYAALKRVAPDGDFSGPVGRAMRRQFDLTLAYAAIETGRHDEAAPLLAGTMPYLETCCVDTPLYAFGLYLGARLEHADGAPPADVLALVERAETILEADGDRVASVTTRIAAWRAEHLDS